MDLELSAEAFLSFNAFFCNKLQLGLWAHAAVVFIHQCAFPVSSVTFHVKGTSKPFAQKLLSRIPDLENCI